MVDAVYLFARGLSETMQIVHVKTETLSCSKRAYEWDAGSSLLNVMKLVKTAFSICSYNDNKNNTSDQLY